MRKSIKREYEKDRKYDFADQKYNHPKRNKKQRVKMAVIKKEAHRRVRYNKDWRNENE